MPARITARDLADSRETAMREIRERFGLLDSTLKTMLAVEQLRGRILFLAIAALIALAGAEKVLSFLQP